MPVECTDRSPVASLFTEVAALLACADDKFVVSVVDYGISGDSLFVAMELCESNLLDWRMKVRLVVCIQW